MSCDMSEMRKMPLPREESLGLQIQMEGSFCSAYSRMKATYSFGRRKV